MDDATWPPPGMAAQPRPGETDLEYWERIRAQRRFWESYQAGCRADPERFTARDVDYINAREDGWR